MQLIRGPQTTLLSVASCKRGWENRVRLNPVLELTTGVVYSIVLGESQLVSVAHIIICVIMCVCVYICNILINKPFHSQKVL